MSQLSLFRNSHKLADRDVDHPGMLITRKIGQHAEKIMFILSTQLQLPLYTYRLKRLSCCFSYYSCYYLFFRLNISLYLKKL
jgi:hypothetical protein